MSKFQQFCQTMGLHPLVGFGMAAIDLMLFGSELAGIGWVVSIPVAVVFSIASALIQKHGFKDEWGLAIGKALLIGCLIAIPTPIGAVVPLVGGVLGLMAPKSPS
ncbi:MAG: hypothetical protein LW717_18350 [Chloroflexaceae bacterium]|jgi:Sec-independent protein secretion pathway component TatC|nr:hypothetical protein [Chloroflexaceae bacterium]